MLFFPFLPQLKISNNKSIPIFSYSSETRWQNGDGNYTSAVENRILNLIHQNSMIQKTKRESFPLNSAQHLRYRRNIQESPGNATKITNCENFTFVIKSKDRYEVWNNFSIRYKGKIYLYDTYRVIKDGLYVCNSSDDHVQQIWKNITVQHKQIIPYKHCRVSVDSYYHENYTLFKDFNVFFKPTSQNFTREDYGVISGYFSICSAKLSLSCNKYLLKVKYGEQYNVFNDLSLIYSNRKYDYREYRISNNMIEICASNHSTVLHIWRTRNSLEKSGMLRLFKCSNRFELYQQLSSVSKHLTVYFSPTNQYVTTHDYDVLDGELLVCYEKLKRWSYQYTKEDLLMCNDSIINLKYDDKYKVWNNFSILYQKRIYHYTEYRALNDSIKICNSTDDFVKNVWKLRNNWVMAFRHLESCIFHHTTFQRPFYSINKDFNLNVIGTSQYFTRNQYDVLESEPVVCTEIIRPDSLQHSICNDSIINIKYNDEYKVWNNFSILHKNKIYSYNEFRALNEGIQICNSTYNFVKNIWKLRNNWVKARRLLKSCEFGYLTIPYSDYIMNKRLTVYNSGSSQYFTRNDYDVNNGIPYVCKDTLRPNSYQYTKEDLLMCNDSIINIKYDDEYKVWNNFSIFYKNNIYSYTEYQALNDGIKICNSTDNLTKNIWKLRNKWVKGKRHSNSCNFYNWRLRKAYYSINKQLTVYESSTSQYFTRHDYDVIEGEPFVCTEIVKDSFQYTKEDQLMCNDSIINIKYNDEYKVWKNFSIYYRNKMYSYTEYRALNDSIKICNSTENLTKNIWKLRNKWVKGKRYSKSCNFYNWRLRKAYYSINRQLTVYESRTSQYFTRHHNDVIEGEPFVCTEIVRDSFQYTKQDLLMCNDSITNLKYEDEYKVWNNFSIVYKNKMYSYTEYRALNDGIKICNSTDNFVKTVWELRNYWVTAERRILKNCDSYYSTMANSDYIVNKQLTVYYSGRSQYFTRNYYKVIDGTPYVCQDTLIPDLNQYTKEDLLMCNDSIINVKYDDEYKVWNNFSILYKNKMYSYIEYRALNDSIKVCNSSDSITKNIWKLRNYWVMAGEYSHSCEETWTFHKPYYSINKQFTIYESRTSQYFKRYYYDVRDGELVICREIIRSHSYEYTQEDLLMCNNSIINIKYDDEYKVWNNFSILYKNKMYSYTEYRALNDSIKICNSTDNFTRNIWKLRNKWVIAKRHLKSCNFYYTKFPKSYYSINKDFNVYVFVKSQYFKRHNYGVDDGRLIICTGNVRPSSYQYTRGDLFMCNDSIINIKYDDEYKVWNNFSLHYKNKMYSYTEYRALNDGIKICNSTDNFTKNVWKFRNYWVMLIRLFNICNKPIVRFPLYQGEYDVLKDFTVLIQATKLSIAKNEYGIFNGIPVLCVKNCVSSTFTINYEDEYRVWNNFTVMYKGKMYNYFDYRVTDNGLQICNSSDRLIKEKWRNLTALEKRSTAYADCNVHVTGFYHENYTVYKTFGVFFKPTNQNFTRQVYGVISGYFAICTTSLSFSCNGSLLEVQYGEQYEVFKNFSVFYKQKVYDYIEYRFSRNGVKICTSNDVKVQAIWKTQNKWAKSFGAPCDRSYKLNAKEYTVTKKFVIHSKDDGQIFNRYEYSVIDASPYVCKLTVKPNYIIAEVKIIVLPLFALALSFISLVLLFMVYCLLPQLRTLPGLNLMSLCFAFLLWQIYLVVLLSSYSHVGKLSSIPCERLFVITKFITYSIVLNAAVNIYHLRQTFCGIAPMKSEKLNKRRKFLKYCIFSWGIPVAVAIVYIVLVKTVALHFNQLDTSVKGDVQSSLRFNQRIELDNEDTKGYVLNVNPQTKISEKKNVAPYVRPAQKFQDEGKPNISINGDEPQSKRFYKRVVLGNENNNERIYQHIKGDCINGRITPSWTTAVDVYGIQGIIYHGIIYHSNVLSHCLSNSPKDQSRSKHCTEFKC